MNLPFGIPNTKLLNIKTGEERTESIVKYKQKLDEYKEILENYKKGMIEYSGRLEGIDKRFIENQLSIVQMALDLTYIKEQSERQMEATEELKSGQLNKILVQIQNLTETLIDTSCKIDSANKNIISRMTEVMVELQKQVMQQNKQLNTELVQEMNTIRHSIKTNRILLWIMIIFNFAGLGAIAFLILYNLQMLPF